MITPPVAPLSRANDGNYWYHLHPPNRWTCEGSTNAHDWVTIDLGAPREIDALHYLSNIVIEHLHPAGGKALWDEGYRRVNSDEMFSRDRAAYEAWRSSPQYNEDVERVRRAKASTPVRRDRQPIEDPVS